MPPRKQNPKNKILKALHGGGPSSQGGAQQGTGARGEQYLDGLDRSHTLARKILFEPSSALKHPHTIVNKIHLNDSPFFRSKRTSPALTFWLDFPGLGWINLDSPGRRLYMRWIKLDNVGRF